MEYNSNGADRLGQRVRTIRLFFDKLGFDDVFTVINAVIWLSDVVNYGIMSVNEKS